MVCRGGGYAVVDEVVVCAGTWTRKKARLTRVMLVREGFGE
jgi:hypothetical protein